MKSFIISILLLIIPICAIAQERQFDQNYQEGEKLFDNKEYNRAYTILIEAAKKGHPGAQFLIGKMYMLGCGVILRP